jgi:hypothetical protein
MACCGIAVLFVGSTGLHAANERTHRTTLSLDGQWDVEDSVSADAIPTKYGHQA